MKSRVLVVDDSAFVRRVLSDWIKAEPDMELVGTARDGQEAVTKANELRPDVITLDVNMPDKDGLWALGEIMDSAPTAVIMVSSLTLSGAELTLKALDLGALDFVTKPQSATSLHFLEVRDELLAKIRMVRSARAPTAGPRPVAQAAPLRRTSDQVVLIASSTGGPKALTTLWEGLPIGFPSPILMVQHMPAGFTESFAKRLDQIKTVPCRQAVDGDRVVPGQALLAPGGRHMVVRRGGRIELVDAPSLHGVRPAADMLFKSAANVYGSRCLGVVLTGMGRDGADGAAEVRSNGGAVLGEAESTCVIYGMPKAAKEAGGIDLEVPINEMARAMVSSLSGRVARAS